MRAEGRLWRSAVELLPTLAFYFCFDFVFMLFEHCFVKAFANSMSFIILIIIYSR
jgi:hypothetical protein